MNEVIIDAEKYCNIGRFVNSSKRHKNCKPVTLIYNKNSLKKNQPPCYEFGVFIVSAKDIAVGEQLFYDYDFDSNYWYN